MAHRVAVAASGVGEFEVLEDGVRDGSLFYILDGEAKRGLDRFFGTTGGVFRKTGDVFRTTSGF